MHIYETENRSRDYQKLNMSYNTTLIINFSIWLFNCKKPGPGCSKLTTSLVNVSVNFQINFSNMPEFSVEKM